MPTAKPKAVSAPSVRIDKRIAAGDATRKRIMSAAVAIAGSTGFSSLTIGTLAEACGLSKSSMFTHFPTREDLVVATLDAAYDEFDREVLDACRTAPVGDKMRVFLRGYYEYLNNRPKSHACIVTSAAFEFDGARDRVRKRTEQLIAKRRDVIRQFLLEARQAGVIHGTESDIEQQLFDYESLMVGFVYRYQLDPDPETFKHLVAGVRRLFPALPAPPAKTARKRRMAIAK